MELKYLGIIVLPMAREKIVSKVSSIALIAQFYQYYCTLTDDQ